MRTVDNELRINAEKPIPALLTFGFRSRFVGNFAAIYLCQLCEAFGENSAENSHPLLRRASTASRPRRQPSGLDTEAPNPIRKGSASGVMMRGERG